VGERTAECVESHRGQTVIDIATLAAKCNKELTPINAKEAVKYLKQLSPWWLTPEAIAMAKSLDDPVITGMLAEATLLDEPGSCWVILKFGKPMTLLRSAVLLPCVWRKGEQTFSHFPTKLKDLSDSVIEEVRKAKLSGQNVSSFGLQPDRRLKLQSNVLDDDLFSTFESGWLSLVGGLVSAMLNVDVDTSVWASSAWDASRGGSEVAGLSEKIGLATDYGAKSFAVAAANELEAKQIVAGNSGSLSILTLARHESEDLSTTLRPYLSKYLLQPDPPILADGDIDQYAFGKCKDYYLVLGAYTELATRFYKTHLLPSLSIQLRKNLVAKYGKIEASHYVGIVSKSPELVVLGVLATRAKKCLLLHDGSRGHELNFCRGELSKHLEKGCILVGLFESDVLKSIGKLVTDFLNDAVDPKKVVIDLKPGTKKMTFALIRAAQDGNRMLCLEEQQSQFDRRAIPGTEAPEFIEDSLSQPNDHRTQVTARG
jgi:hypothetical protein